MVRVVGIIIPKCKLILTIPGMLCNKSERSQVLYLPSMGMSPRPISTRPFYVVQLWYVDFYQDLTCAFTRASMSEEDSEPVPVPGARVLNIWDLAQPSALEV